MESTELDSNEGEIKKKIQILKKLAAGVKGIDLFARQDVWAGLFDTAAKVFEEWCDMTKSGKQDENLKENCESVFKILSTLLEECCAYQQPLDDDKERSLISICSSLPDLDMVFVKKDIDNFKATSIIWKGLNGLLEKYKTILKSNACLHKILDASLQRLESSCWKEIPGGSKLLFKKYDPNIMRFFSLRLNAVISLDPLSLDVNKGESANIGKVMDILFRLFRLSLVQQNQRASASENQMSECLLSLVSKIMQFSRETGDQKIQYLIVCELVRGSDYFAKHEKNVELHMSAWFVELAQKLLRMLEQYYCSHLSWKNFGYLLSDSYSILEKDITAALLNSFALSLARHLVLICINNKENENSSKLMGCLIDSIVNDHSSVTRELGTRIACSTLLLLNSPNTAAIATSSAKNSPSNDFQFRFASIFLDATLESLYYARSFPVQISLDKSNQHSEFLLNCFSSIIKYLRNDVTVRLGQRMIEFLPPPTYCKFSFLLNDSDQSQNAIPVTFSPQASAVMCLLKVLLVNNVFHSKFHQHKTNIDEICKSIAQPLMKEQLVQSMLSILKQHPKDSVPLDFAIIIIIMSSCEDDAKKDSVLDMNIQELFSIALLIADNVHSYCNRKVLISSLDFLSVCFCTSVINEAAKTEKIIQLLTSSIRKCKNDTIFLFEISHFISRIGTSPLLMALFKTESGKQKMSDMIQAYLILVKTTSNGHNEKHGLKDVLISSTLEHFLRFFQSEISSGWIKTSIPQDIREMVLFHIKNENKLEIPGIEQSSNAGVQKSLSICLHSTAIDSNIQKNKRMVIGELERFEQELRCYIEKLRKDL